MKRDQDELPQPQPRPTQDQAKRVNKLEKSREALHAAVNGYRALLRDKTLASNKLDSDRQEQMKVFTNLNKSAGDLEGENAGEGILSLAITALNSVLYVRDELNTLRYDQAMLYRKFVELEKSVKVPVVEQATEKTGDI